MLKDEAEITPRALLREMRGWFDRIARGASVKVTATVDEAGFELVATRADNGREVLRKRFTPASIAAHPRRPCDHARDFLRECLVRRGAA